MYICNIYKNNKVCGRWLLNTDTEEGIKEILKDIGYNLSEIKYKSLKINTDKRFQIIDISEEGIILEA